MANEKRMIDAGDLSTQFDDIPPYIGLAGSLVKQYIDKAPTVDAVEVVRCMECGFCHYNSSADSYKCTTRNGMHRTVKPKDYCSYGERKPKEDGDAGGGQAEK